MGNSSSGDNWLSDIISQFNPLNWISGDTWIEIGVVIVGFMVVWKALGLGADDLVALI